MLIVEDCALDCNPLWWCICCWPCLGCYYLTALGNSQERARRQQRERERQQREEQQRREREERQRAERAARDNEGNQRLLNPNQPASGINYVEPVAVQIAQPINDAPQAGGVQWQCDACTLINPPSSSICSACGTHRYAAGGGHPPGGAGGPSAPPKPQNEPHRQAHVQNAPLQAQATPAQEEKKQTGMLGGLFNAGISFIKDVQQRMRENDNKRNS
eukprot:CAMPEP_0197536548 /NCGR_PEP_ID=MMETSP1318-20131121/54165_1 /TAXON_ID=552666 /ORGANISM="Partenskyella glossopodia, Strain RCC365" /LENGTH=216 /DNA_ID=CAMNT_0043094465 /DNA_START=606 /DNA_END=1256 /DNA_ORIENTATION=+